MLTSKFNSWDKGVFSVLGTPGAPPSSDTLYWFRRDQPGVNPDSIYSDTDITYKWNSYGFRSDEFIDDNKKSLLFIGCSYTMGLGCPLEHTWPAILRNKINKDYKIYNLGLAGCSNDYVVRALYKTIDVLNPEAVFIMWAGFASREVPIKNRYLPFKISSTKEENNSHEYKMFNLVKPTFIDQSYFMYQHTKNKLFAEMLCKIKNIPLQQLSIIPELNDRSDVLEVSKLVSNLNFQNPNEKDIKLLGQELGFPFARDKVHWGHEWNNYISDLMLTQFKNNTQL